MGDQKLRVDSRGELMLPKVVVRLRHFPLNLPKLALDYVIIAQLFRECALGELLLALTLV